MHIYNIKSEAQSIAVAKKIASKISIGSIIALKGSLGAGKTFITKHIIRSLLEQDINVTSPTFQLLQIYKAKGYEIYHYDLYRLKNKNEIFELGFEDAMNGRNICIIEWPEIIFDLLPEGVITIELGFDENNQRFAKCLS